MWLKDSCCLLFSVFQNILLGRWEERKSGKEHGRIFRPEMVFMVSIYLLRLFCFIRSTSSEYGSSQARGQIGATAASLHHSHSNGGSELHCNLHHSSWQRQIPDPQMEARGQICILMVRSRVRSRWATTGTPSFSTSDVPAEHQLPVSRVLEAVGKWAPGWSCLPRKHSV